MKRTRGLHLNDPCVKGSCVHSFKRTFRQEIMFFFPPFQPKTHNEKIGSVGSESGYAVLMHIPFEIMNGAAALCLCGSAVKSGRT